MFFQLIWWIILGLIAGALARWILPGEDPMGLLMTALLGIAGSFLGGLLANMIWHPAAGNYFHPGGIVSSVLGAIVLLWAIRKLRARGK
jgi:uncharacterized membrane protein YeaQ/YmgE (transglycosylase-associated protein family)